MPKNSISLFCSDSPKIIDVKVRNKQDRKFFDPLFLGMFIFLWIKFATSLLALLTGDYSFFQEQPRKSLAE